MTQIHHPQRPSDLPAMLSVADMCELLRIAPITLTKMCKEKLIPEPLAFGLKKVWLRDAIFQWLEVELKRAAEARARDEEANPTRARMKANATARQARYREKRQQEYAREQEAFIAAEVERRLAAALEAEREKASHSRRRAA